MYSTVSVSMGISWCVQYCISKYRGLLFYCSYCFPTVSDGFLLFLMFSYCFRMQKVREVVPQSLSQVHALAFRRYIYDVPPGGGARLNLPCAVLTTNVPRLLHVPHGHGTGHGKDSVKPVIYILSVIQLLGSAKIKHL